MAAIFKIENQAPAMGDAEAQWLIDNLPEEFMTEDESVVGIRFSLDDFRKARDRIKKPTDFDKHMLSCCELMLSSTKAKWVDLLVRW